VGGRGGRGKKSASISEKKKGKGRRGHRGVRNTRGGEKGEKSLVLNESTWARANQKREKKTWKTWGHTLSTPKSLVLKKKEGKWFPKKGKGGDSKRRYCAQIRVKGRDIPWEKEKA